MFLARKIAADDLLLLNLFSPVTKSLTSAGQVLSVIIAGIHSLFLFSEIYDKTRKSSVSLTHRTVPIRLI